MLTMKEITRLFRVDPGSVLKLKRHDTGWAGDKDLRRLTTDALKEKARGFVEHNLVRLAEAQERLAANDVYSVLVVLQAIDAAGKDGMVKHVMSGLNPQGCQVFSFKRPSEEELDHNYLWRYSRALPERGRIGIFNRSYYEEVLIVRVHPEILESQKLPEEMLNKNIWKGRYESIRAFEEHLHRNGTAVIKFFLHLSRDEQKKRFLARIDNPEKNWKFNKGDVDEREHWDDYLEAYQDCIAATSTKHAPWYIVPADHKPDARLIISQAITERLESLDMRYPRATKAHQAELKAARKALAND